MELQEIKNHLGHKIRTARKKAKLTQPQLSKKANTNSETISQLENGAANSKIETLAAIAKVLKINIFALD
jgi:transcriptional regulator with XRE-family HTH domain